MIELFFYVIVKQRGKRVHWRIDITEIPLISGDLSAGMQIDLAQHKIKLLLGKVLINHIERYGMKCQIPCRIPWIFPFIRHGYDVIVYHVIPFPVAYRPLAAKERM